MVYEWMYDFTYRRLNGRAWPFNIWTFYTHFCYLADHIQYTLAHLLNWWQLFALEFRRMTILFCSNFTKKHYNDSILQTFRKQPLVNVLLLIPLQIGIHLIYTELYKNIVVYTCKLCITRIIFVRVLKF